MKKPYILGALPLFVSVIAHPNIVPQGRFGMLDSKGFQLPDLTTMGEDRIRVRAADSYLYADLYPYVAPVPDYEAHLPAAKRMTLPDSESQPVLFRHSIDIRDAEPRAWNGFERKVPKQSPHKRDLAKMPTVKHEDAARDIHEALTSDPNAKVMLREVGGLLGHFTKRDGSPLTAHDLSLLTRDMNTLLARHIETPHEIHEHAEHAFEHAKNGLEKVGKFFKNNWEKVVDVATSALSFTPVGLAVKAAEGIEKGAMAIKNAVTGAKAANKANDAKDQKDQHDQNKAAKKPGKRDADVNPESLATTIAGALNTLQARGLSGPFNTIINRHEIEVRDPKLLRERLIHLFKREIVPLLGARVSSNRIQHLNQRSLGSSSNTMSILLQRDADGVATGLSEVHMQALAPHLINHM